MRIRAMVVALAGLPFVLGGCGGTAGGSDAGATRTPAGAPWVVVDTGNVTPSARPPRGGSPRPALPPVSFLPTTDSCAIGWPDQQGRVLIPMVVTPGAGAVTVQWPNRYGNTYRLTAVPQELVAGAQPEPPWQTVTTGAECEVSATIRGLEPGAAYVVWLDAPDTPRRADGSRSLYTGRSGIVRPN